MRWLAAGETGGLAADDAGDAIFAGAWELTVSVWLGAADGAGALVSAVKCVARFVVPFAGSCARAGKQVAVQPIAQSAARRHENLDLIIFSPPNEKTGSPIGNPCNGLRQDHGRNTRTRVLDTRPPYLLIVTGISGTCRNSGTCGKFRKTRLPGRIDRVASRCPV